MPIAILTSGCLTLDHERATVSVGDKRVELKPTVYRLLSALMARGGDWVRRETLMVEVWKVKTVEDGAIRNQVHKLRGLLGQLGLDGCAVIQVRSCHGLRFVAPAIDTQ